MNTFYWIFFLAIAHCQKKQEQTAEEKREAVYFRIYELIDSMEKLTPFHTFYDLFGVSDDETSDKISKAYKKKSMKWHPDKNDSEEAQKMFTLFSGVNSILRDAENRKHYNWIINEAPAWHRSAYSMKRVMTPKVSLEQVGLIVLLCGTVVHYCFLLIMFFIRYVRILMSRSEIRKLGVKERKKLESKIGRSNDSQVLLLELSESEVSFPSVFDVLFVKLVLSVVKFPYFVFSKLRKTKSE